MSSRFLSLMLRSLNCSLEEGGRDCKVKPFFAGYPNFKFPGTYPLISTTYVPFDFRFSGTRYIQFIQPVSRYPANRFLTGVFVEYEVLRLSEHLFLSQSKLTLTLFTVLLTCCLFITRDCRDLFAEVHVQYNVLCRTMFVHTRERKTKGKPMLNKKDKRLPYTVP